MGKDWGWKGTEEEGVCLKGLGKYGMEGTGRLKKERVRKGHGEREEVEWNGGRGGFRGKGTEEEGFRRIGRYGTEVGGGKERIRSRERAWGKRRGWKGNEEEMLGRMGR